jgi:uncharacterized DUF497 family protein
MRGSFGPERDHSYERVDASAHRRCPTETVRRPTSGNTKFGFPESLPVFEKDNATTITRDGSGPHEQRFLSIGTGVRGRVLVVIYSYRVRENRIISVCLAEVHEPRKHEQ